MTTDRFSIELQILNKYLNPRQFRLTDRELILAVQTNSLRTYTIKVDLTNDYPYNIPKAFVTTPKPLRDCRGLPMIDASHAMHTLPAENGCTRICHYGTVDWSPRCTLYQVYVKIRTWLEIYEYHLKTGRPLDSILTTALE